MPGIKGEIYDLANGSAAVTTMGNGTGAFTTPGTKTTIQRPSSLEVVEYNGDGIVFDASLSNSEYGSSSTVMPASVDVTAGIYLGHSAKV